MNNEIRKLERKIDGQQTSHILHLLLSIITFGLWLPVWLIVGISHSIERGRLERKIDQISD